MAILRAYHKPESLAEAVALLRQEGTRLVPLAGGTHLVGALETRQVRNVNGVVDLAGLGLSGIGETDEGLGIGAMTTLAQVAEDARTGELAGGLLRRTARFEGPVNLRNAATVGGLVALAEPDSEMYAALLALGAAVTLSDGKRRQSQPLADFSGPAAGGLITGISIPWVKAGGGHARVARTPMDRCIVAAVAVVGDGIERVALCGVDERPVLAGGPLTPPDDWKASAGYRREMAGVVQQRALAKASREESNA